MKNIKYIVLFNGEKSAMIMRFNSYYKIQWLGDDSLNFRDINSAVKHLMDLGFKLDYGSFLVDSSELRGV